MAERITDERRAIRVANELSRRTNVDSVPQVRYDRGIINLRALEQDLSREKNIIPSPLKENLNYNHEIRETILNWILTVSRLYSLNERLEIALVFTFNNLFRL